MKIDPGWIAVITAVVFFYIRMYQLRGRRRREARQEELARLRAGAAKRKPGDAPLAAPGEQVTYRVGSWWLIGAGAVVMLIGLALRTVTWAPEFILPYWWAVVTVGVVLFTFGFK